MIKTETYCDRRLRETGLDGKDITSKIGIYRIDAYEREKLVEEVEIKRITSGAFDKNFQPTEGPDMVFHYVGLNRKRIQYFPKNSRKARNLYRVRFSNPAIHFDRNGDPIKYKSPPGSGTHLWLPEYIIRSYEQGKPIHTLYVTEGEMKAEKACKHGIPMIGTMGIHNIAANKELPKEFEMIIKQCQVKRVVFLVDADCFDLSEDLAEKPSKFANLRPNSFYSAVANFREYFHAFTNSNIFLHIYFAHVNKNEEGDKGVDDMLANSLRGEEHLLEGELIRVLNDKQRKGTDGIKRVEGKYITLYDITEMPKSQLKKIWGLGSAQDFAEKYADQLIPLERFRFWKEAWKIDENGKIELAQPITADERYWEWDTVKGKLRAVFLYTEAFNFLEGRNFGRYMLDKRDYIFVNLNDKILSQVEPWQIRDYVIQFTERIGEKKVLEMLYRGSKMYLGPEALSNMKVMDVNFHKSDKDHQYLYFQSAFWEIDAIGIRQRNIADLPAYVWEEQVKPFTPELIKPMLEVKIDHNKKSIAWTGSDEMQQCDFAQFIWLTSLYNWRMVDELEEGQHLPPELNQEHAFSFVSKCTAIGYMLHRFRNPSQSKAVIAMDVKNSEVGASQGRTGKSLIGVALEQMVPTVFVDGKKRKMMEDQFLLEEVDNRTAAIWFDDVRRDFDFEGLFSMITGNIVVNKKGKSKFKLDKDQAIKFFITTNHAIDGETSSFLDRQVLLGFSDYFNDKRKPVDEFGQLFFDEWDRDQWNLFYNFMATCIHLYFKHGLVRAPEGRLIRRRLRQQIGEDFLNWAEVFFGNPANLNRCHEKKELILTLENEVPAAKRWQRRTFKKKLKAFAKYAGLHYNPMKPDKDGKKFDPEEREPYVGGDHKTGGKEFITLATEVWTPDMASTDNTLF